MATDWQQLPFEEAISFFRQKVPIPSTGWQDLQAQEHDWVFTVAGVTKAEMVADFQAAVDQAIAQGTTIADFQKSFDQIVADNGWTYRGERGWRSETILFTNIRTAYAAGRHTQMSDPDVLKDRPYWEYRHGDSRVPRPLHLSWDGLVLAADDPFWETHYPPCGFGCKCRAFSVSERDLERMGKSGPDEAPNDGTYEWTDKFGEVHTSPRGVDPGWNYTPGASPESQRQTILKNALVKLPEELQSAVKAELKKEGIDGSN